MTFSEGIAKICRTTTGYNYLALKFPDKPSVKVLVHRLVLAAFVGPSPLQANHKDGNKDNNRLDNLEYCTPAENIWHCINVLGRKRGSTMKSAKLKEKDVFKIRDDTRTLREIAAEYGVTPQAIWMVKKRKNWAYL